VSRISEYVPRSPQGSFVSVPEQNENRFNCFYVSMKLKGKRKANSRGNKQLNIQKMRSIVLEPISRTYKDLLLIGFHPEE
jgi:hypothetical protein